MFLVFLPSAINGRDDNDNKDGPEPQVKEEQLERSKRCTGFGCTGRYSWRVVNVVLVFVHVGTVREE